MNKFVLAVSAAAVAFVLSSAPASAMHCPADMKKIDAVLNDKDKMMKSGLKADDIAKIKGLRSKGEGLHKAGKHKESVESLGEAMKMLGIQ